MSVGSVVRVRLQDFEGLWQINRKIEDRMLPGVGLLAGEAWFLRQGDGLHYVERGQLRFANQPPLETRQSYVWRAEGSRIAVSFADGRPFHRFEPDWRCAAAHWCDPDQYDVGYDFSGWPDWSATWVVRGPRKDYTMRTRHTRAGPPP